MDKGSFLYAYVPEANIILKDNKKLKINKIRSQAKMLDFFDNFLPIWKTTFNISIYNLHKLKENLGSVYINLVLYLQKYTSGVTGQNEPYATSKSMGRIFVPFIDPKVFDSKLSESVVNEANNSTIYDKNPTSAAEISIEATLYDITGLLMNKTMVNAVLANVSDNDGINVATAISYVLKLVDDNIQGYDGCIIDSPDNTDLYKEIILPPKQTIKSALTDLQNRYGIYTNGLTTFFDNGILYILDRFKTSHEYKENEYRKIHLQINTNITESMPTVITEKDEDELTISTTTIPKDIDLDIVNSEIIGNKTIITSYGMTHNAVEYKDGKFSKFNTPIQVIEKPGKSHTETGNKIQLEYDELNNPYNVSAILRSTSPQTYLEIPEIDNIPIDIFRPNIIFNLSFPKDQERNHKYAGDYVMSSGTIMLQCPSETDNRLTTKIVNLTLVSIK